MKKPTKQAFAIIRFDKFLTDIKPLPGCVTVKEIVMTKEEAEIEVQRLNSVNLDKQCIYFCQVTRLIGNE